MYCCGLCTTKVRPAIDISIACGLLQVHSLEDREEALKHDRGYIGKRYVTIRVISEQAMKDFLAKNEIKAVSKYIIYVLLACLDELFKVGYLIPLSNTVLLCELPNCVRFWSAWQQIVICSCEW